MSLGRNFPGYLPTTEAVGDNFQSNYINHPWLWPFVDYYNEGPRRHVPREPPFREYRPGIGWVQGDRKLHNFKPNHYFTRPHDGKRPGSLGRFKDAMTGKGADVFITTSGDKRTLMRDRPQKWQWSGWPLSRNELIDMEHDPDTRDQDYMPVDNASWTRSRGADPLYNYRNRKYTHPKANWLYRHPDSIWRGADWAPGAKDNRRNPLNKQDLYGQWWSRVSPFAGLFPGGRPAG